MQVACVKPNKICHGQGKEWEQHTTKKNALLNCETGSSDISGYHANFHEDTALSEQGRGAAWHV
jgi:hypothetical protein